MKTCRKCDQEKSHDDFPRDRNRPDGRFPYCKLCHSHKQRSIRDPQKSAAAKKRLKEKRLANDELMNRYRIQTFEYSLRHRYGIEPDRYLRMIESQGGQCAICREVLVHNGKRNPFRVDHDHECCPGVKTCGNCVRSLLCNGCNSGLGYFKEDICRLQAAIEYLNQHQQSEAVPTGAASPIQGANQRTSPKKRSKQQLQPLARR